MVNVKGVESEGILKGGVDKGLRSKGCILRESTLKVL